MSHIARAAAIFDHHCERLLETALEKRTSADVHDVGALAFFHKAINQVMHKARADATGPTTEGSRFKGAPLHEAIRWASDEDGQEKGEDRRSENDDLIAAASEHLVRRLLSDAIALWPEGSAEAANANFAGYREVMTTLVRTLLHLPNVHALNVVDDSLHASSELLRKLVRLDRLPKQTPLTGLRLLDGCWRDYDVAMLLATRYKRACKVLFLLQLLLNWLVVAGSSFSTSDEFIEDLDTPSGTMSDAVFILSVALAALFSLEGMLSAKSRWRQLRSASGQLQSIVWMYRARVPPFDVDTTNHFSDAQSGAPETELAKMLSTWRQELMSGANLASSNFVKQYPPDTFRHYQLKGRPAPDEDDYQSPVRPQHYIELRIRPMITFYEKRVPQYTRSGIVLKVCILLLGIAASVLARYRRANYVVLVSAAAAALTSLVEFADVQRKVERYSRAVIELRNLLAWWSSLSGVQRASTSTIATLVTTSEQIISEERLAWLSTANTKSADATAQAEADEEAGEAAHTAKRSVRAELGAAQGQHRGSCRVSPG